MKQKLKIIKLFQGIFGVYRSAKIFLNKLRRLRYFLPSFFTVKNLLVEADIFKTSANSTTKWRNFKEDASLLANII